MPFKEAKDLPVSIGVYSHLTKRVEEDESLDVEAEKQVLWE